MSTIDNIRRGELKRLLLRRGTSKIEVHNKVEDIIAQRTKWTSLALGWRVYLTFDEKIRLSIRTIACIDRPKKMVQLYFRQQKRERDRMRWARKKRTLARDLSPLAKQVAQLVAEKCMRVAEIVELLRKGPRSKHEAARSAVRRALEELDDLLDVRLEARPTGGFERFVRLKKPENAALLDTSMQEKSAVVDSFGEASDFRPPVTRPPVKFSPPHRRSSTSPGTSRARSAPKSATRLTDSYYTASTAKTALPQRGGRAGACSKVVSLKGNRLNKRAAKREGMPPSGRQLLCVANGGRSEERPASAVVGERHAKLADLIKIIRAAARDPAGADWAGIQERYHVGLLHMAVASLPDHHERKTAEKYLLANAMRRDGATQEAIEQTVRVATGRK